MIIATTTAATISPYSPRVLPSELARPWKTANAITKPVSSRRHRAGVRIVSIELIGSFHQMMSDHERVIGFAY